MNAEENASNGDNDHLFQDQPRRILTWRIPGGETKTQIDYVNIKKRFRMQFYAAKHIQVSTGEAIT